MCKTFIWWYCLFVFPQLILANDSKLNDLNYLGVEQGLSSNDINSIYQSAAGYIWIGTTDGLNRYDAHRLTIIRKPIDNKAGLPSNHILDIIEDDSQQLLISTMAGLSWYDPLKESYLPFSFRDSIHRQTRPLTEGAILAHHQRSIILGTKNHGLLRYDYNDKTALQIPLTSATHPSFTYAINDMHIDSHKNIWLAIEGKGIAFYDGDSKVLRLINTQYTSINCLILDSEGNLILGSDNAIITLDKDLQLIAQQQTSKEVINLSSLNGEEIWASTDGQAFLVRAPGQLAFQPHAKFGQNGLLSSNSIKDIFVDRNNNYWIATVRGGVNIINGQKKIFHPYLLHTEQNKQAKDPYISSFCEVSNQHIWLGTDGYGLYDFNRSTKEFTKLQIKGLKSNHITSVLKDRQGNIWVGTWSAGLFKRQKNSNQFQQIRFINPSGKDEPKNIWKLFMDNKGQLWASTYGQDGVFKWDEQEQAFLSYSKEMKNVLTFAEDQQGNLWMGSDDYLIRHHLQSKQTQYFKFGLRIRAIYPDQDNKLWVGTEGAGLLHFNNSNGRYKVYDEAIGFSNNNILNILPDQQGNLWCSTFNGLNKFDLNSKTVLKFTESDGLQNNRFNYLAALKLSNNDLLFGGTKGLNIFTPQEIKIPKQKFSVQITGVKINGVDINAKQHWSYIKEISAGQIKKLELPYDKGLLSISYSTFDYNHDQNLEFQAMLAGLSTDWMPLGSNRTINYSRLPAGNYQVHIRAIGRDHQVYQTSVLDFAIAPPWYLSKSSIILYITLAFLSLFLFVKISKYRTKLQYEAKIATLKIAKEKEFSERKLHFFTETLQELKTPITMVINPINELINAEVLPDNKNLLLAQRNASKLLVLTEQFDLLKNQKNTIKIPPLVQLDIFALLINEFDSFKQLAKEKSVEILIQHASREMIVYANQQKIELILFNLILNAIENVEQGGKILVALKDLETTVQITVSDHAYIPKNKVEGVDLYDFYHQLKEQNQSIRIELLMVYQMVKEHFGKLTWEGSKETGNTITVELHKGDWFSEHQDPAKTEFKHSGIAAKASPEIQTEIKAEKNSIIWSDRSTILLVEEDLELREYLKEIFESRYVVHEASSCKEALEKIKITIPHLIISAIFSDKSGFDFCRMLKADQKYMHLPIFLIGSSGSNEELLQSISAGAEEFIERPFDQKVLLAKIQTIFDSRNNLQQYFMNNITLQENHSNISLADKEFLENCIAIIEANLTNQEFNAQLLATMCHMSYSNLYKKVRAISDLKISSFIRAIRLRKAAVLMLNTELTINEIAYSVGVHDIKYFREKFKEIYGLTPSGYIKKYRTQFKQSFSLREKGR